MIRSYKCSCVFEYGILGLMIFKVAQVAPLNHVELQVIRLFLTT